MMKAGRFSTTTATNATRSTLHFLSHLSFSSSGPRINSCLHQPRVTLGLTTPRPTRFLIGRSFVTTTNNVMALFSMRRSLTILACGPRFNISGSTRPYQTTPPIVSLSPLGRLFGSEGAGNDFHGRTSDHRGDVGVVDAMRYRIGARSRDSVGRKSCSDFQLANYHNRIVD